MPKPIFAPVSLPEDLLKMTDGYVETEPVSFIVHAKARDDIDRAIPLTDCFEFINFEEGPVVFAKTGWSITGMLGPVQEYDGNYHLYLFIAGDKAGKDGEKTGDPAVTGRLNINFVEG